MYSVSLSQLLYSYCSDLLVKSITGVEDHKCIAYSNTVEIFFNQQDQLQTVKSEHCDYITKVLHY